MELRRAKPKQEAAAEIIPLLRDYNRSLLTNRRPSPRASEAGLRRGKLGNQDPTALGAAWGEFWATAQTAAWASLWACHWLWL